MRVVVTGATGNVGTSVLDALGRDDGVTSILGIARRLPAARFAKTEFAAADVAADDLEPLLGGADCVVHLAWLIQPSHDEPTLRRTNVEGSRRTFAAVVAAGVPALVVASSIGAYSPRADAQPVDESWPTGGSRRAGTRGRRPSSSAGSTRSRPSSPSSRVVRLRPAITTKREAASGQRRLFAGPLLPTPLLRPGWIPFVPDVPGLDAAARPRRRRRRRVPPGGRLGRSRRVQHRGRARARSGRNRGRPRDPDAAAARPASLRGAARATWLARLQPTSPDWIDLALGVPVLDSARARSELGWAATRNAVDTLREVVAGMRERAGRGRRRRSRRSASGDLRSGGGILQPMSELPRTDELPRSEEGYDAAQRRGGVRDVRRPRPRARVRRRTSCEPSCASSGQTGRGPTGSGATSSARRPPTRARNGPPRMRLRTRHGAALELPRLGFVGSGAADPSDRGSAARRSRPIFLVLVALLAGLADLSTTAIAVVMAAAWALVVLAEWAAAAKRARWHLDAVATPLDEPAADASDSTGPWSMPVVEATVVEAPDDSESHTVVTKLPPEPEARARAGASRPQPRAGARSSRTLSRSHEPRARSSRSPRRRPTWSDTAETGAPILLAERRAGAGGGTRSRNGAAGSAVARADEPEPDAPDPWEL